MPKILVIEDDPALLESLVLLLEAGGHIAFRACDGLAGVKIAKERAPNLIVCDIMMPGLDGYGVLKEVRSLPQQIGVVPFIFLSARHESTDVRKGMMLGADDYLIKPFEANQFINAVRVQLEKRARYIQQTSQQIDTMREQLLKALPLQLGSSISSIGEFADYLMENANVMTPREVQSIGQSIYSAASRVRVTIENYLMYVQIEMLTRDKAQLEELRRAVTEKPASLIRAHALMSADKSNRTSDLRLNVSEVTQVRIALHHLGKIIEELLEFVFQITKPGSPINVIGIPEPGRYRLKISSPLPDSYRGNLLQEAAVEQNARLGLLLARRLLEIHGGKLETIQHPVEGLIFSALML